MKNQRTLIKIFGAALLACSAGLAAAEDTQILAVSATVPGTCKFSAASTPLAFGSIDMTSTAAVTQTANVVYRCTKNTASLGITGTTGAHLMTSSGGDKLAYTMSIAGDISAGTGFGASGSDLTAVVTGTIAAADFQTAAAGNYTEDVTLTITP